MSEHEPSADVEALPVGRFTVWLGQIRSALHGEADSEVPCGSCTACCASSQFVTIAPDETAALAAIPRELLFPAPGLPGHLLMGYDERGRCPMLTDAGCSVYAARPRTCRVYDCRVFPAAGVTADKPLVRERAERWQFDHPTPDDETAHAAVRAAAHYVAEHPGLREDAVPLPPTGQAVLAVRAVEAFLDRDAGSGQLRLREDPSRAAVRAAVEQTR